MIFDPILNLPYGDVVLAVAIVISSVLVARIFIYALGHVVLHVTKKTKTTLDDVVIEVVKKPIYFTIILAGLYLAIDVLDYVDAYLPHVQQVFEVVWILLGAYTCTKMVKAIFRWYATEIGIRSDTKIDETLAPIVQKVLGVFIYTIAFIIILHVFGVEITPLLAGLGIGGLAVALALQDTLSNLFSGAFVVSDKVVHTGDYIELENGVRGSVQEIGWRSTRLKTPEDNIVVIPNSKLASSVVTNYNAPQGATVLKVSFGVSYGSDLEKVEKITMDVASHVVQSAEGGKKSFTPVVRYTAFGESNIDLDVIMKVEKVDFMVSVRHEFIKALKKRYDEEGIEISFPVRKIIQEK